MKKIPSPPSYSETVVEGDATALMSEVWFRFVAQLVAANRDFLDRLTLTTSSTAPTAADIQAGDLRLWKNTGTGTTRLYINDGGVLKSITFT